MDSNKWTYKFTSIASGDLDDIIRYLSKYDAHKGFINNLEKSIDNLLSFPYMAPLLANQYVSKDGIRKLVIDNYNLCYIADDINKVIIILRILHYRMDNRIIDHQF